LFSIGSHKARCFFITKVVYLPPVKLGVVLLTQSNAPSNANKRLHLMELHFNKSNLFRSINRIITIAGYIHAF